MNNDEIKGSVIPLKKGENVMTAGGGANYSFSLNPNHNQIILS